MELLIPATLCYLADPFHSFGPQPAEIYQNIQNALHRVRQLRMYSTMDPISYDTPVKESEGNGTLTLSSVQ
jgi:hypothetical protein